MKPKRLSRKRYVIGILEHANIVPHNFALTMQKEFSTQEVDDYYTGIIQTRYAKRKLRKAGL